MTSTEIANGTYCLHDSCANKREGDVVMSVMDNAADNAVDDELPPPLQLDNDSRFTAGNRLFLQEGSEVHP